MDFTNYFIFGSMKFDSNLNEISLYKAVLLKTFEMIQVMSKYSLMTNLSKLMIPTVIPIVLPRSFKRFQYQFKSAYFKTLSITGIHFMSDRFKKIEEKPVVTIYNDCSIEKCKYCHGCSVSKCISCCGSGRHYFDGKKETLCEKCNGCGSCMCVFCYGTGNDYTDIY